MTALAVPEGLEPLGVWDIRDAGPYTDGQRAQQPHWLLCNVDYPVLDFARFEFYALDGPFTAMYPWDGGEPVIVPLAELPPARLLKG